MILLNVENIPGNAYFFQIFLSNFNIKDTLSLEGFFSATFDFSKTKSPSDNYSRIGYETTNFTRITAMIVLNVLSSLLVLLAYKLFKHFTKKYYKIDKVRRLATLVPDKNVSEGLVS
jgi:hypothetical protein